jgi:hypothetical protein
MRELHERASAEIEKQDKIMKRKLAIVDANKVDAGGSDDNNPKISEQDSSDPKVPPQVIVNVQSDNNITEASPQVPDIQPAEKMP